MGGRAGALAGWLVALALLLAAAPDRGPAAPVLVLHDGVLAAAAVQWPPDRGRLAEVLRGSFDLPGIAAAVLGTAAATPGQRDRLAAALGERLLRQVQARRPEAADRFDILETRVLGPAEWLVLTRLAAAGQAGETLAWRVRAGAEGARIVDVLRGGVSAVITLRHDIASALRTRDLDAVIGELERPAD